MALVRVELGAGRVADDPQPVGDPEPAVARVGVGPATSRRRSARARGRAPGSRGRPRAGPTWPSAVDPSSRSMTCAPSVPAPGACPQRAARPSRTLHAVVLERPADRPPRCADGPSGPAAARTGRSSPGRRTARTPGRSRSPSARRRGRGGSRAARGRASPRGSSTAGRRRGPRSAASSTSSRPRPRRSSASSSCVVAVVGHGDAAPSRDPALPRYTTAPSASSALTWIVSSGSRGVRGAVDHVVAPGRGARPRVVAALARGPPRRGAATSTARSRCAGTTRRTTAGR